MGSGVAAQQGEAVVFVHISVCVDRRCTIFGMQSVTFRPHPPPHLDVVVSVV